MSVLPIVTGATTPVLRTKATAVPRMTKEIDALIDDMLATCKAADGLGLAAPQVNRSIRVCVARVNGRMTPMINPVITRKGKELEEAEEGCLSLPEQYASVPRSKEIAMRYLDRKGAVQERKLTNMDARVVQHEVDHLDGVLIVDYVTVDGTEYTRNKRQETNKA